MFSTFLHKIIKGFTLIELFIVIIIIGVLAIALIPRIQGMQNKARYVKVQKDLQDFRTAVFLAQTNASKSLGEITGVYGSYGACGSWGFEDNINLRMLPANHPCRLAWVSVLRKVEGAAGLVSGALIGLEQDPWGSPYLLDENDGESGWGCGGFDTIHSTGPDGYGIGINRGNALLDVGDNKGTNIMFYRCPGGY